jgi:cytochrome c oxidase cbb3-type subunit 2
MSRSGFLFPILLIAFATSLGVTVLIPHAQLGGLTPDFKEEDGLISDVYPNVPGGLADVGRQVYVSEGCQTCHTQVVRGGDSADVDRGWGVRRTVARDHVTERTPVLGALRLGPDLSNVGSEKWRNEPSDDPYKPAKRDASWHLKHLYNPLAMGEGSIMPSYKHLFLVRKITGTPSPDALKLPQAMSAEAGYEVVPKPEAKALVAYLASLDRSHPLKEAGKATAATTPKK